MKLYRQKWCFIIKNKLARRGIVASDHQMAIKSWIDLESRKNY